MATYNWPGATFQTGVVGNAAVPNSAFGFGNIGLGSNVNTSIPVFSTFNGGLALKNVTTVTGYAGFTFDGSNLIIANTTANTNVIISNTGAITMTGDLSVAGNISGNGAGLVGVSAGGLANGTSNVAIPVTSDNVIVTVAGTPNIAVFSVSGVSITGNVSGNYILGNGALLTGITSSGGNNISSGASNVDIASSGANVTTSVAGNPNILVAAPTGVYVTGEANVTGNVAATYFIGNGSLLTGLTATVSNIVNGTSNVSIPTNSGNIDMGVAGTPNVLTVASTGTFVSGNSNVTGTMTAGTFIGDGSLLTGIVANSNIIFNGTSNVEIASVSGYVTTAVAGNPNITTVTPSGFFVVGDISASGNITGNLSEAIAANLSVMGNITSNGYFVGNGAYLTGITTIPSSISNGLSNVDINSFNGNIEFGVNGTFDIVVVSEFGLQSSNNIQAVANIYGGNLVATSGNVSGNYILGNGSYLTGLTASTGNITFSDTTLAPNYTLGNITLQTTDTANSLTNDLVFDAAGNLTGANNTSANYMISNSGLFYNANTIVGNHVIPDGYNAMSAGPITLQAGANVTGNGNWVIV